MELKEKRIIDILHDRVKENPNGIAIEAKNIEQASFDIDFEERVTKRNLSRFVSNTYTWKELDEITDYMALQMLEYEIPFKEHVGIWYFNSEHWVFTFLAICKIGAIPVLFNSYLSATELKNNAAYADCHFIFVDEISNRMEYHAILHELKQEVQRQEEAKTGKEEHRLRLISMVLNDAMQKDIAQMRIRFSESLRKELLSRQKRVDVKQPACMMFTSGTSSVPKGVLLSHYSLVNNASAIADSMHWTKDDKMCICVPMFHCFGMTAGILSCMVSGATMYILARFKTGDVWDSIVNGGCTILNGVPSMFMAMIRKEEYKDFVPKTLQSGIIAGSAISPKEYMEICERLQGARIQPSYGQTETSPCVSIADWEEEIDSKAKNCGKAIEHVEVKISETNKFDVCFQSEEEIEACRMQRCGEILVKGYNTMMGYYKRQSEEPFTEDGWLRTGDVGYLDEEGRLYITGRIKEMIIRAGENISPFEIEECMRQIEGIKEVKVIGIAAEVVQEEILACIILEENAEIEDGEIYRVLKKKLASYKIPSEIMRFEEFPLTSNGKVDLKRLKEDVNHKKQQVR